jgi:hypothetical protein
MFTTMTSSCGAEIFSLGEQPWKGVPDLNIMKRQQNREKLPCPPGCPQEIYALMLECWRLDVNLRINGDKLFGLMIQFIQEPSHNIAAFDSLEWPELETLESRLEKRDDTMSQCIDLSSTAVLERFASLEVSPTAVTMGKLLGSGQFGSVFLADLQSLNGAVTSVAVKTLQDSGVPQVEQKQFEYEAKLLSTLHHPNVVTLVAVCFRSFPHLMLLEVMENGDLKGYLKTHKATLSEASKIGLLIGACCQVADAMHYLAGRQVVHRDLAARF